MGPIRLNTAVACGESLILLSFLQQNVMRSCLDFPAFVSSFCVLWCGNDYVIVLGLMPSINVIFYLIVE